MCLLASDLLDYLSCDAQALCCSEAYIQVKLDVALDLVNRMTGQDYCPDTECVTVRGSNDPVLFLFPITTKPLTSLTSVKIRKCSSDCDDWETIDTDYIEVSKRYIRYCNDCFPKREVQVCGTFGEVMPAGYKDIVFTLAKEYIQPGSSGLRPSRLTREDFEDTSQSYQQDYTLLNLRISTGFTELDERIQAYINPFHQVGFNIVNCTNDDCEDRRRWC